MKKRSKILASLLLALVMVFTLTSTAFAATVENATDHSYDVYQIFSGTQATGDPTLGDVVWGSGIDAAGFLAELKTDNRFGAGDANIFKDCDTAAQVAVALGNKSDVANAFANVAAKHLTTVKTAIAAQDTSVELDAGYYLLVDTKTISGNDARNSALLQVTNKGNITIEKKYDVPSVDKGIVKGNELVEADDVNIGDDVTFRLTGTLPSNYADYETYKYVFHDTLSAGLSYNGDAKVYLVNGSDKTEITSSFTITHETVTLTISCSNLKALSAVSSTSEIVVEYTAKLTSDAEIGQPGNKNEVYLEYSNDPNQTGSGEPTTSNTPKDEVLVFTYELDVTKVDGETPSKKLKDAEFVLYKEVTVDGIKKNLYAIVDNTSHKITSWSEATTETVDGKETITYPTGSTLTSDANGFFKIAGLDAGTYYLKETKAPAGYNLLTDPIKIVISATLDTTENNPALTKLDITVGEGEKATTTPGDLATGVVATDVENNKGATLPETGGIGTTIFYVLGGALVIGAAVLLITKKRMNAEK